MDQPRRDHLQDLWFRGQEAGKPLGECVSRLRRAGPRPARGCHCHLHHQSSTGPEEVKKATRAPPTSTLRPPSIPQPSLPPAWTRGPRNQHPPLGTGSGPSPGTLLSPSPKPAKLSGWAHEMTLHVSRWQRRACDGERTAPAAGGHQDSGPASSTQLQGPARRERVEFGGKSFPALPPLSRHHSGITGTGKKRVYFCLRIQNFYILWLEPESCLIPRASQGHACASTARPSNVLLQAP